MPASLTPQRMCAVLGKLPATACYWVAYSGGLDSHVLLHLLAAGRPELGSTQVRAVHVNHGLQGDASAWAQHCRSVCEQLSVPCALVQVDARPAAGESPESAARRVRYQAIASVMGSGDVVLSAHHQDDQAETVLIHLLRGSGPHGLAAMADCRPFGPGWLARPLLDRTRSSLRRYAESHGLRWIEDPSNREDQYERNFLRNEIMPVLKMRWPSLAAVLARAARHQADAARILDTLADLDLKAVRGPARDTLRIDGLAELSDERQRNVLRRWVRKLGLPLPTTRHLQHVIGDVLGAAQDAMPRVDWEGAQIRRYRGLLYAMAPLRGHDPGTELAWRLAEPLPLSDGVLQAGFVTGDGIRAAAVGDGGVTVRFRRGGERCLLPGRRHSQSLKKLLQERGVPPWIRERLPLVYLGGELAAVAGLWVCEPFAASGDEQGWAIRWRRAANGWREASDERSRAVP